MKSEDLFNAIGEIDDNLIESAKPVKVYNHQKKAFKWAVCLAACICLIFVGYSAKMSVTDKLSSIDLSYVVFEPTGMGLGPLPKDAGLEATESEDEPRDEGHTGICKPRVPEPSCLSSAPLQPALRGPPAPHPEH